MQAFEQAIDPLNFVKSEAQIGLDLLNQINVNKTSLSFNAAETRILMSSSGLREFTEEVVSPKLSKFVETDMEHISF